MYLLNKSQLLPNDLSSDLLNLRQIGLEALEKAISAVKPKSLMNKAIKLYNNFLIIENDKYDLRKYQKIYIIGGGKAVAEMALSLESELLNSKDINYRGIINIPEDQEMQKLFKHSKISLNYSSHPIPNESGFKGTKSMIKLVKASTEKDLIICLISGGGSALLSFPKNGIDIKDLQEINSLLLASGASIHEINTIRKHISGFKGGNLAKKVYDNSKAKIISIIISDVVGDNLGSIASGPTVPDTTTYKDAYNLLIKYNLLKKVPHSIKDHLEEGLKNKVLENPKPHNKCFTNVHNYLIGSINSAVQEVTSFLENNQFKVHYFSNSVTGEAREFGTYIHDLFFKYAKNSLNTNNHEKIALIGTGELTVKLKGKGIGGRNQEMLLSFLHNIKKKEVKCNFLVIGANLDGIEGNSKAMGALVDNAILDLAISKNYNIQKFLLENDSNSFFKKLGGELISGPTGCNVNDIILILILT